jgi:hypothetical protein
MTRPYPSPFRGGIGDASPASDDVIVQVGDALPKATDFLGLLLDDALVNGKLSVNKVAPFVLASDDAFKFASRRPREQPPEAREEIVAAADFHVIHRRSDAQQGSEVVQDLGKLPRM